MECISVNGDSEYGNDGRVSVDSGELLGRLENY